MLIVIANNFYLSSYALAQNISNGGNPGSPCYDRCQYLTPWLSALPAICNAKAARAVSFSILIKAL